MIKLHLGCGKRDFGKGWTHIDGGDFPHLHSHDITKLPFKDNSVDLIYNCHVLSYFDREEVIPVLKEWYRVLKPKGVLRTSVTNFNALVRLYTYQEFRLDSFLGPMFGKWKMGDKTIYHKTIYDADNLISVLSKAGFKKFKPYDWKQTEHSNIDDFSQAYLPHMDKDGYLISLNMEATK